MRYERVVEGVGTRGGGQQVAKTAETPARKKALDEAHLLLRIILALDARGPSKNENRELLGQQLDSLKTRWGISHDDLLA